MAVLLFVDLLGARAHWRSGGVAGAKSAFDRFTTLMLAAAKPSASDIIVGGIETDAAAIVTRSVEAALYIAQRAYQWASRTDSANERLWLRGCIGPFDVELPLRDNRPAAGPLSHIDITVYQPQFLEAISVEKSGIKGMRCVVASRLITPRTRAEFRIPVGTLSFVPFRVLRHATYPKSAGQYEDFLWMSGLDEAAKQKSRMSRRLRWASHDPEEFAQAAATQVVFHEYDAILQSLHARIRAAAAKQERKRSRE